MERYHIFKLGLAVLIYATYCIRPMLAQQFEGQHKAGHNQSKESYFVYFQGVEGQPGIDFPIFSHIPRTKFSCGGLGSGYYADLDTDCQVFHICDEGRKISFLCPNGTIFEQSELICEWWFKVNCTNSPSLYEESAEHLREDIVRRKAARKVNLNAHHGAIMRTEERTTVSAMQNGRNIHTQSLHGTHESSRNPKKFTAQSKPPDYSSTKTKPFNLANDLKVNYHENKRKPVYTYSEPIPQTSSSSTSNHRRRPQKFKLTSALISASTTPTTTTTSTVTSRTLYYNTLPVSPSALDSDKNIIRGAEHVNIYTIFPTTKPYTPAKNYSSYSESNPLESQTYSESASFLRHPNDATTAPPPILTTSTTHPNHRNTYSEIQDPKIALQKIKVSLSSVTPQYITTQSINSGKPFIGSQVGAKYYAGSAIKSTPAPFRLNQELLIESQSRFVHNKPRQSFSIDLLNTEPEQLSSPSTSTVPSSRPPIITQTTSSKKLSIPPQGTFNTGIPNNKPLFTLRPASTTASPYRTIDHATVYGKFIKATTPLPKRVDHAIVYGRYVKTGSTPVKAAENRAIVYAHSSESNRTTSSFFVTKKPDRRKPNRDKSVQGLEAVRPRPFQPSHAESRRRFQNSSPSPSPTFQHSVFPTYMVSTAAPFSPAAFNQPTARAIQNIDSMIAALMGLARQSTQSVYSTATPRPGLSIPPSAGPQTLHSLARYFANALDSFVDDDDPLTDNNDSSEPKMDREELTELLTQMTMHRYRELFNRSSTASSTTESAVNNNSNNDLDTDHTQNAAQSPKIRKLARVFTQALSSYLDDPDTFKRVLQEVRPTEPPPPDGTTSAAESTTDMSEDELLNFSDADSPKTNYPNWGYLLATPNPIDLTANSITGDMENLQGDDTQSFISQYNRLRLQRKPNLPMDHWTSSHAATKLWKSTFSFDPKLINQNIVHDLHAPLISEENTVTGSTENEEAASTTTEEAVHSYQLDWQSFPNTTHVRGILMDLMNNASHPNRLNRILRKLNTTQEEFVRKMQEIDGNPLTRRLILLLVSECGHNGTEKVVKAKALPVHHLVSRQPVSKELLQPAGSSVGIELNRRANANSQLPGGLVTENSHDGRAVQLLNSLYDIAARFG